MILLPLSLFGAPPTFTLPKRPAPVKEATKDTTPVPASMPKPKATEDSLTAKPASPVPVATVNLDSSKQVRDSIATVKPRADTVVLIRHHFNHKEQIIAGGVVMACLAAMMAVMNNYNPR